MKQVFTPLSYYSIESRLFFCKNKNSLMLTADFIFQVVTKQKFISFYIPGFIFLSILAQIIQGFTY